MIRNTITLKTFEELQKKYNQNKKILKWRDLNEDQAYQIINKETVKTKNGDSLVIVLADKTKVWACSSLAKRLEEEKDKSFPCYIHPKGKVQSKQNEAYQYYGFELVWPDDDKADQVLETAL